jgi:tetratricopeptide (TPR) repeat protein
MKHVHKWEFRSRFRRHAFGWKSQPAIKRIKEAVSEIRQVARKDGVLAAEGAVLLLEKLSPAIENVDSSSGAIGSAVNAAIEVLVSILAKADVAAETRQAWLERIWLAYQDDEIPYLESLGDHWGKLCASADVAMIWVERLLELTRQSLRAESGWRDYFKGTSACLSALLAAERYADVLCLLDQARDPIWFYREYGIRALAAMGQVTEAIQYAESNRTKFDNAAAIARVCEQVLLDAGRIDEAYNQYGLLANRAATYASWFRAVARKYRDKEPAELLEDLVAFTPMEEGKWFAAAKDAGLFEEAIVLANRSPCSPQTLTRAARDFAVERPEFARDAGMAALRWLVEGHGYEVTSLDVNLAFSTTMQAAENAGSVTESLAKVRALLPTETAGERFVTKVLRERLRRL